MKQTVSAVCDSMIKLM